MRLNQLDTDELPSTYRTRLQVFVFGVRCLIEVYDSVVFSNLWQPRRRTEFVSVTAALSTLQ